jgi:hypothetical protein
LKESLLLVVFYRRELLVVNRFVLKVGSFTILRGEGSHNTFFCYMVSRPFVSSLGSVCGVCAFVSVFLNVFVVVF